MTTKYPTLAKPPIKEAILQLLVLPSDTYEQDLLKIFVEKESDKYPNNAPQKETLIQFISGEEGQHAGVTNKGVNGYKITSEDGQNRHPCAVNDVLSGLVSRGHSRNRRH